MPSMKLAPSTALMLELMREDRYQLLRVIIMKWASKNAESHFHDPSRASWSLMHFMMQQLTELREQDPAVTKDGDAHPNGSTRNSFTLNYVRACYDGFMAVKNAIGHWPVLLMPNTEDVLHPATPDEVNDQVRQLLTNSRAQLAKFEEEWSTASELMRIHAPTLAT